MRKLIGPDAGVLLRAAWLAASTVMPTLFAFPGNNPRHWLPEAWDSSGTPALAAQKARTDQAKQLSKSIAGNRNEARKRALKLRASLKLAFRTVSVAGVLLLGILVVRQVIAWNSQPTTDHPAQPPIEIKQSGGPIPPLPPPADNTVAEPNTLSIAPPDEAGNEANVATPASTNTQR